ncbi:MAG: glutamate 5-kinase, partial [Actinomyces sp.]
MTRTVVVKIGTSSITDDEGAVVWTAVENLCAEVARLRRQGDRAVIVSSGAIAAGLPELGLGGSRRPTDVTTLQAVATVGQGVLMSAYRRALADRGLVAGQVLLVPYDFVLRHQYLHARSTLRRLLDLGVVPVVNENDAIADDEIRYGDNDRLAALLANLVGADLLVLLTDTDGVLTADPRLDPGARLIEEIHEIDERVASVAGGAGSRRGSGGMASKLTAARIAAWSGIPTVIARASVPGVVGRAVAGEAVGTYVHPRPVGLSARRLWIAFAVEAAGRVVTDAGARAALERGRSLLTAGVRGVEGDFVAGDAVDLVDEEGEIYGKGLARPAAEELRR